MEQTGTVFNIQRFSIHDGPGIRTTVFFKGCPLSCRWCANPESIAGTRQLMTRDIKCVGCGACAAACPEQGISISEEHGRRIDWDRCTQCFDCVDACLYNALTVMGDVMTSGSIVEEVEKDRLFYKNSGGGVTFSGGEPLTQPNFLKEILTLLKEKGHHITLDTTGFANASVLDQILPLVDLVLLDIKHLDSDLHQTFTGVDNRLIQENAARIAQQVRTWFRIPLIESVNADPHHISQIADLAASLRVEKISLLPFHEGGIQKWGQLGIAPPDFHGKTPEDNDIKSLAEIISKKGVHVGIRS